MELISIIVPVYKVEKYLDKCVKSVINQSYEDLEIILVDDGSPDNCGIMCDAWAEKDSRIKVIHKQNGGLSDARNAGLSIATGEYIAFVDSDDWIETQYIEYLYQAIRDTDADIAACEVSIVSDNQVSTQMIGVSYKIEKHMPKEALEDLLHGRRFRAVAWNKLYHASMIKEEKFEVGRLHEDEFFTYRIYDKASSLVFVDAPLYNYVQREGSIMTTISVRHLDVLDAYIERFELLKDKYPVLYKKDKVTFCSTCLNFYCDTLTKSFENRKVIQDRIKQYRKKIIFPMKELLQYSLKELVYIIASSALFVDLFAKLRVHKGY